MGAARKGDERKRKKEKFSSEVAHRNARLSIAENL
jgi:hypothetical protein